jgi:hypothetical protein
MRYLMDFKPYRYYSYTEMKWLKVYAQFTGEWVMIYDEDENYTGSLPIGSWNEKEAKGHIFEGWGD